MKFVKILPLFLERILSQGIAGQNLWGTRTGSIDKRRRQLSLEKKGAETYSKNKLLGIRGGTIDSGRRLFSCKKGGADFFQLFFFQNLIFVSGKFL